MAIIIVALVFCLFDVFWCKRLLSPERDCVLRGRSSGSGVWVQIPTLLLTGYIILECVLTFTCCLHWFVKCLSCIYSLSGAVLEAGVIMGNKNGYDPGSRVACSSVQEMSNNHWVSDKLKHRKVLVMGEHRTMKWLGTEAFSGYLRLCNCNCQWCMQSFLHGA